MPQTVQRSFTAGEIAPAVQSRADLNKYAAGLNLCENFIVRAQGGVYNRPGFMYCADQDDHNFAARLIPFSFNTTQTYILIFEDEKIRVMRDCALILAEGTSDPYEIPTNYTSSDLAELSFTQSADVMTIVHPDHPPANLSRTADNVWSLDDIDFAPSVTAPVFSGTTVKSVTGATQANPVQITATAHGFSTGNTVTLDSLGGMTELNGRSFVITVTGANTFTLDDEDGTGHTAYTSGGDATRVDSAVTIGEGFGDFNKTYTYVVTAVDENGDESLPSTVAAAVTSKSLSQTGGIRLSWGAVSGADYYRVYKDPSNGTGVYGWIGDTKVTTFDDYNIAPLTSDAPPEDRQPFNGTDNRPSAVTYYQQRLVFANTNNEPQAIYTTQTNIFDSLRTSSPARDDDAVTFTINARQVNEIRHLLPLDTLIILTSGGEWKLTEGQDQVLTPATVGARIQSYNGSSTVPPVVINSTAIYLQEKNARLRDLNYEFTDDKYTGNDLSIMAEHLFEGQTITAMAFAAEPYSVIWCVRSDGVLLGLTYQREHRVWGWHKHTTNGTFESVAVITEDGRDAVYVTVKRTINGTTKRYIERLEDRESTDAADAFYVDSGLTYSGAAATTISGLDHLEGETVTILADGYTVPDQVVSSGQITLTRAASKVHIGLSYTPAIETLDIANPGGEQVKSRSVSVSDVVVELEKSRGGWVGPKKDMGATGEMREIKPRFDTDGYDAIALKTYKADINVDALWSRSGGIRIEQRDPLPMAILSITPQIDVGGI